MVQNMLKRIMILMLATLLVLCFIPTQNVIGAGPTSLTVKPVNTNYDGYWYGDSTWMPFYDATVSSFHTVYTNNSAFQVGWDCRSTGSTDWKLHTGFLGFDVSAIPEGAEISSIKIRLYLISTDDTGSFGSMPIAFFKGVPDNIPPDVDDMNNWYDYSQAHAPYYSTRISTLVDMYDYLGHSNEWIEFNIYDPVTGSTDYVTDDADGIVWFYLMTTNHYYRIAPSFESNKHWRNLFYDTSGGNSTYYPQLVITYTSVAEPRIVSYPSNAATDNTTTGSETTANITWGSPRAAYQDEGIYFIVNGDSGANITLEARLNDGSLVAEHDDTIRTDNNYDWYLSVPESVSGFIRAYELNSGVQSEWGYVAATPDDDEPTNYTFAIDTVYPQYDYNFSDYIVGPGDIMLNSWKTNIDWSTESANYSFGIELNGQELIYSDSLEDMNDTYFKTQYANNDYLAGWRYCLTTMDDDAGFNSYDGMIINLNKPLTAYNKGFQQATIFDNSDNETLLTTTHSAYWYLSDINEGIRLSLDKSSYQNGETITLTAKVGPASQVPSYLPTMDTQQPVGGQNLGSCTVLAGDNILSGTISALEGEKILRVTFSGSSVDGYEYVRDIDFTLGDSEVSPATIPGFKSGIEQTFSNWLSNLNLDNTTGHYIIIILFMIALFVIFFKSGLLRVVMPLMVLAVGIVIKWVDIWLVILLAMGVGITAYRLFRAHSQGGGD